MYSLELDFIFFLIVVFTVPIVIGALSSSPRRAVMWVFLLLGGGLAFEVFRDWWRGREEALLAHGVGELIYILVGAFAVFGGLAVLGYKLKQNRGRQPGSN